MIGGLADLGASVFGIPLRTPDGLIAEASRLAEQGERGRRRAEDLCAEALRRAPEHPGALAQLAALYAWRGLHEHALSLLDRACSQAPGHVGLLAARATIAAYVDPVTADRCAWQVLNVDPYHAAAHRIIGFAAVMQGDLDAGEAAFRRAADLDPGQPDARIEAGACLMQRRAYGAGFAEWARAMDPNGPRRWSPGEPLAGRTVLLISVNGIGDDTLMVRWVPALAAQGARVVIATPWAGMVRLLKRVPGVDRVIFHRRPADLAEQPAYSSAVIAPLWATAHMLGVDGPGQHAAVPYLSPDPRDVERWRARLPDDGRLKIAIIWGSAGPWPPAPSTRGLPLRELAPLGRVPGIQWFSLQQGPPAGDLEDPPFPIVDLAPHCRDLAATAAAMMVMDHIVTVDTGPGNLAGALGAPASILLRAGIMGDWRWGYGDVSPWYPSARAFRQEQLGDWSEPVERVADELARLVAQRGAA